MSSKKKVLVCVTQQKTCERLIKKGVCVRDELDSELFVIHVAMNGLNFLGNSKEGDALEYLFGISKRAGAELTVLRSDDIVKTIVGYTKDNKITDMIVGEPPNEHDNNIIRELKQKLPGVNIYVIPPEEGK
jgi:K+-sensing histidine kinase KdpD